MYKYANPDDGYAYSNVELTAIWAIPVSGFEVINGPMQHRWKFFMHCTKNPKNPDREKDQRILEMLTIALLAEVENNEILTAWSGLTTEDRRAVRYEDDGA